MKIIMNWRLLTTLLLFSVSMGLNAQSTETRSVGSFHGIKSSNGINVYLNKGNSTSVKVTVEGADLSDVRTVVEGGVLKIEMGKGNYRNVDVSVEVTFTNLDMIAASSASGIFSDDIIHSRRMEVMVNSAATVELVLDVQELSVNVSSAGDAEISGKAQMASFDVSSAGDVDAYDLKAQRVNVMASSAGEAKVIAEMEIVAMAASGGSVKYKGNPQKSSTDSRSGGSVRKTN